MFSSELARYLIRFEMLDLVCWRIVLRISRSQISGEAVLISA